LIRSNRQSGASAGPFGLRERAHGVFYGWWVIASGSAIIGIGSVYFYGFSIFFLPLTEDLGLSRASTSLVFSVVRLEGGIEGPLAGWATDRYGPRRMLLISAALTGTGFIILATVDSFLAVLLVYTGMISLGYNIGFFQAMVVAANNWFVRRRTLAISILSASYRLFGAGLTPIIAYVVVSYGWRAGAVVSGLLILAVAIPAALFVRSTPESMGLRPDGDPPEPDDARRTLAPGERPSTPRDFSVGEAVRTPAYWAIAIAHGLRTAAFAGLVVHIVPILVWKGLSEQSAANLWGLVALIGLPMTLFIGWGADRWNKPAIMVGGMICSAFGMLLLLQGDDTWLLYLFVAMFALGESIGPVNWSILGERFGRARFATLRGYLTAMSVFGAAMPVIMGRIYDVQETYAPALIIVICLYLIAAVLYGSLLIVGKPRRTAEARSA
jgi:sugar phosphate permease